MSLSADDIEQIDRLLDDKMELCAYKGAARAIEAHERACGAPKAIKATKRWAGAAVLAVLAFVLREAYNKLWG